MPVEDLSPSARATAEAPMKSRPITNDCASPSGRGWTAYSSRSPRCLPSPRRRRNPSMSDGVEMSRMFPDPREHQRRQGVIHHRLVVDRQQLLRHHEGERMQARAGSAGEKNPFHWVAAHRSRRPAKRAEDVRHVADAAEGDREMEPRVLRDGVLLPRRLKSKI